MESSNHVIGYHGSSDGRCIWCGRYDVNEYQECPVQRVEVEKKKAQEKKFRGELKKFYKRLDRNERAIIRELCRMIDRGGYENPLVKRNE
jgi:hypothetical protein